MKNVRCKFTRLRMGLCFFALAYVPVSHAIPAPPVGSGWVYGADGVSWVRSAAVNYQNQAAGKAVWSAANSGVWTSALGGGSTLVNTSNVAFGTSRAVAGTASIVARGAITGAKVFTAVKALSGGPVGITLLLALPVVDWLTTDMTRPNPFPTAGFPAQIKDSTVCTVAPCYEYHVSDGEAPPNYFSSPVSACQAYLSAHRVNLPNYTYVFVSASSYSCIFDIVGLQSNAGRSMDSRVGNVSPEAWLPASMDDIAPYMYPRPATPALIQAILNAGGTVPVDSVSVTGPALVTEPPLTSVTNFPQRDLTSSSLAQGNPFGLVDGAPAHVTASSTGQNVVTANGGLVSIPTHTESVSTYSAPANQTTTTTTTTQDPHTVTTKTTPTTALTYGLDTVSADTKNVTVTNITNNTTNVTNTTTENATKLDPVKPSEPCAENPDSVGCLKVGEPPVGDLVENRTHDVTVSPVSFASGGSCPSPLSFNVVGHTYSISYSPICDQLGYLKVLFMAMAAVLAAFVLADSFRVT